MSRDYSHHALTMMRRNRVIAGFHKSNPGIALQTSDVSTQAFAGTIPIYSTSLTNNGSTLLEPCNCNPEPEPLVGPYLFSYNHLTDDGFQIGNVPTKDMNNVIYTSEFNPYGYQTDFFPGMSNFVDGNIRADDKNEEDRLLASRWYDLGNDVVDRWGFFYLYDPSSQNYYFPLFNPQNQDDGIISTQTFSAFGRSFTIQHGWTVQGIFKIDITVDDAYPFRFGCYGNMGFNEDGGYENLNEPYSVDAGALSLYYHHNYQVGDSNEQLYIYTIPKMVSENADQTYEVYYSGDNMNIMTKSIRKGVIMYLSESNDVKDWVINDIGSMP